MDKWLPLFSLFLTAVAFLLNVFAMMRLIPLFITLPLLFTSIYLLLYSFFNRHVYRGWTR